jgi:hypothetical protein
MIRAEELDARGKAGFPDCVREGIIILESPREVYADENA